MHSNDHAISAQERSRNTVQHPVREQATTLAPPPPTLASTILHLQRTAGNRAVNGLLQRYKAVAPHNLGLSGTAQRTRGAEATDRPEVGSDGGQLSETLSQRRQTRAGSGSPLNGNFRTQMEQIFGADFADVHLHTDSESHALNRCVSAKEFTMGSDVFLGDTAYASDTRLMAHELTHVVQQRGTSGSGPLMVGPSDDSSEREADATGDAIAGSFERGVVAASSNDPESGSPVANACGQRQTLTRSSIQRLEADSEDVTGIGNTSGESRGATESADTGEAEGSGVLRSVGPTEASDGFTTTADLRANSIKVSGGCTQQDPQPNPDPQPEPAKQGGFFQQEVFFGVASDKVDDPEYLKLRGWYQGQVEGVGSGSAKVTPQVQASVEAGTSEVNLFGQASNTGSATYNQELSERRAKNVERILQSFAGSHARFNLKAFGPVQDGSKAEEAHARRVLIYFDLADAPPGPQPGPGPNPKPKPQPDPLPQFNAELEDMLNMLQLQFRFLFERQHDALNAVERDLNVPPDAEQSLGSKIVNGILTLSLYALYGGSASALIRQPIAKAVKQELTPGETTDVDNGIDKALSLIHI